MFWQFLVGMNQYNYELELGSLLFIPRSNKISEAAITYLLDHHEVKKKNYN